MFRLQYFARGLQVYIKQLRLALQGKTGEALKTDEVCTPVGWERLKEAVGNCWMF